MGFDFPYTCPKIDKAIASARSNITDEVNDIQIRIARLEQRVQFAAANRYGRFGNGYYGYGYNGYYGERERDFDRDHDRDDDDDD